MDAQPHMPPSHKSSVNAYRLFVFAGGLFAAAGFFSLLFDLHPARQPGFGWMTFLLGITGLVFAFALRQRPDTNGGMPRQPVSTKIAKPPVEGFTGGLPTTTGPKPVSFVAPLSPEAQADTRKDVLSKSITPEILNIRFAAYRCEIAIDHFKAIYQNATQTELKWYEIGSLVIRQFPFQKPWEGKLLLDLIPMAAAGENIHPVRVLSNTYVNYGFLPQGQSASTRENIRRLASFILSQNRSIFIDPATDYFVHAGQPPERFLSMSQFMEYDARYG